MKTEVEILLDVFEEERKYQELVEQLAGDEEMLMEIDHLYQEGVLVDEIKRLCELGSLTNQ